MKRATPPAQDPLQFIHPKIAAELAQFRTFLAACDKFSQTFAGDGNVQSAIGVRFMWAIRRIRDEAWKHWSQTDVAEAFSLLGLSPEERSFGTWYTLASEYEIPPLNDNIKRKAS
jgi:hypothetical protein